MFRRLFGKKQEQVVPAAARSAPRPGREVPLYAELLAQPARRVPAGLVEREQSEPFREHAMAWRKRLLEGRRPTEEQGVFASLLDGKGGVVTFALPDDGRSAVPFFSSPPRAGDYRDSMGSAGATAQVRPLPLPGFLTMLRELELAGILDLSFDRCPRCASVSVVPAESIQTIEQAWAFRCTAKGAEIARAQLYFAYALDAARAGQLDEAREVGLEAVGHVTFEDPNMHLLLGQVGVAAANAALTGEAMTMLAHLRAEPHAAKLASAMEAGVSDFEGPAR